MTPGDGTHRVRRADGPVIAEVQFGSETVITLSVTLPSFETVKVYGTT